MPDQAPVDCGMKPMAALAAGLPGAAPATTTRPESGVSSPVQIAALSVAGSQTTLVLSDVVVRGDSVGVMCGKDGSLWVLRSVIQNGGVGIDSLGCNRLVVEQSIILGNRTEIYTLSLHDALPISQLGRACWCLDSSVPHRQQCDQRQWSESRRLRRFHRCDGQWPFFVQHHLEQRRKGRRRWCGAL